MPNILNRIKKEMIAAVPAIIYFFFAINLFNLTFGWILEGAGMRLFTFSRTIIASIIIGKVVIVSEAMPFLNKFAGRPLMYSVLWKTFIYSFFGSLFLIIERFIPLFLKYKDAAIAWQYMPLNMTPARLYTAQIWMVVLFFLFVTFRELIQCVGPDKVRKIFFGR